MKKLPWRLPRTPQVKREIRKVKFCIYFAPSSSSKAEPQKYPTATATMLNSTIAK